MNGYKYLLCFMIFISASTQYAQPSQAEPHDLHDEELDAITGKNPKIFCNFQRLHDIDTGASSKVAVAINPDGTRIATAANLYDGHGHTQNVRIWDTKTGDTMLVLTNRSRAKHTPLVTFSHSGLYIATSYADGSIVVIGVNTGDIMQVLPGYYRDIFSLAFNHDDSKIVSTSTDNMGDSILLWDRKTEKATRLGRKTPSVISAEFNACGSKIVTASTGGYDSAVGNVGVPKIFDTATGMELAYLVGHDGPIRSAVFHGNSRILTASGCSAQTFDVTDPDVGWYYKEMAIEHDHNVQYAIFNREGTCIATTSRKTVRIFDSSTGSLLQKIECPCNCYHIQFSPNGLLAVALEDGHVLIFQNSLETHSLGECTDHLAEHPANEPLEEKLQALDLVTD
jgi:WD40 repeat protein